MDYMKAYTDWYDRHEKRAAGTNLAKLKEFKCKNQQFYFFRNLQSKDYRGVLGYALKNGKLLCRMWYFSRSEASWRAFTGQRVGGGWMKGAEQGKDAQRGAFTALGYIFECYVDPDLSQAIQHFFESPDIEKIVNDDCCPPAVQDYYKIDGEKVVVPKMKGSLQEYFSGGGKDRPLITKDYDQEREFKLVKIPVHTKNFNISLKTGSVDIQKSFRATSDDFGKKIRLDSSMDAWLREMIKHRQDPVRTEDHPLLGDKYEIYEYAFKDGCDGLKFEIAATEKEIDHDYQGANVKSKICWVRDVYYEKSEITTFGTRRHIPINLSYLIQKPIDYRSQVSNKYITETLYGNVRDKEEVEKLVNYVPERARNADEARKIKEENKRNQERLVAILGKNMIDARYIILSSLNESTSTIIDQFKNIQGLTKFHVEDQDLATDRRYSLLEVKSQQFGFTKGAILLGISEYICLSFEPGKYNASGFHGDKGKERANALRYAIKACSDYDEINRVIYSCFIENRVQATEGQDPKNPGHRIVINPGFNGGFFSKIRTEPTSLFTCVCRALLCDSVQFNCVHNNPLIADPNDGIGRMRRWMLHESSGKLPDRSSALFITDNAANLLTVLGDKNLKT